MKNNFKEVLDTRDVRESEFCANRIMEVLNKIQYKVDLIVNSNNNTINSYSKSVQNILLIENKESNNLEPNCYIDSKIKAEKKKRIIEYLKLLLKRRQLTISYYSRKLQVLLVYQEFLKMIAK